MPKISKKYLNSLIQKSVLLETYEIAETYTKLVPGKIYDIFLSHSYEDRKEAKILHQLLTKCNFSVYLDLNDPRLNEDNADRETAERIAKIMNQCKCLIYLHSQASKNSKWCPWELGYMSGKTNFRCATIPLTDADEEYPKQEYLQMYPYLDCTESKDSLLPTFWVNDNDSPLIFVSLKEFIKGKNPELYKGE